MTSVDWTEARWLRWVGLGWSPEAYRASWNVNSNESFPTLLWVIRNLMISQLLELWYGSWTGWIIILYGPYNMDYFWKLKTLGWISMFKRSLTFKLTYWIWYSEYLGYLCESESLVQNFGKIWTCGLKFFYGFCSSFELVD